MKFLVIASLVFLACAGDTLQGIVSNKDGRIGIREDWERVITVIHKDSPAEKAGLKVGDKVIEVDGHKGDYPITGPVGGTVEVVVTDSTKLKRVYHIKRVSPSEIK